MILVIHEKELESKETDVIGVATTTDNAELLIKEYYGEFKEIRKTYIRDSCLEYSKILEVKDHVNRPYHVQITLEWFDIDKL